MKKITKKWLINSFAIIIILVIALEGIAYLLIRTYYYNGTQQYLATRANTVSTSLNSFDTSSNTAFMQSLRQLIESYEYRDKVELMALEEAGSVMLTSSGFTPTVTDILPDYTTAVESPDGVGVYIGRYNSEDVMSMTVISNIPAQPLTAMRYIVSLEGVNTQIFTIMLGAIIIGVSIIFFVIFTSSFFVNSLVKPLSEINLSTKKIAQGNFAVRLSADTKDEIGELCLSINNMAEELANSDRIKNDFISSISHELRTPLTAIRGWGETILSDNSPDEQLVRRGMGIIMSETQRLSAMVEELLDFSRIQSGRLRLEKAPMDAVAELSDAVLMFTQRAVNENKEIIYSEPEFMAIINGDKNKLRQVFINIIDNALKYSDSGSKTSIFATIAESIFTVTVSDNGIGISADDLPNIKEKFYKGKTSRRGSGIGLAIADEIINRLNGILSISSVQGVGTTVKISLPLLDSAEEISQI